MLRANENEKAFESVIQSQSFNLFREISLHFWKKEIDISKFDYKQIMNNQGNLFIELLKKMV